MCVGVCVCVCVLLYEVRKNMFWLAMLCELGPCKRLPLLLWTPLFLDAHGS